MWVSIIFVQGLLAVAATTCSFKDGNACNSEECKTISVSVYNHTDGTVDKRTVCSSRASSAMYASVFAPNGDCSPGDTKETVYTGSNGEPGVACVLNAADESAPAETTVKEENTMQVALYIAGGSGFLLVFALFACMVTGG